MGGLLSTQEERAKAEQEKLIDEIDSQIYDVQQSIFLERDNPEIQKQYIDMLSGLKQQRVVLVKNGLLTKSKPDEQKAEPKTPSLVQINEVN
jgi:hypothetical protein